MNESTSSIKSVQEPSVYVGVCIVVLSCLLYLPFLTKPFLPDDYLQITLARDFGPMHQWGHLFEDPLFRNRATSLLLTYWTDLLFPLSPLACAITSILLHALNGLLVYGLGMARSIGWRMSALTAVMFAIQERHHEAVIWYASLPELLVFAFILMTLLLWLRWLHHEGTPVIIWMTMLTTFGLALLSKESAVAAVPLMLILAVLERAPMRRALLGLWPFLLLSAAYVGWVFQGQEQNHHFHDGTFVLQIGFLKTAVVSLGRGLWVWGWVALIVLFALRPRRPLLLFGGLFWMLASFAPYSFLTYMQSVPSRHHYLAAVGCSMIIALAVTMVSERMSRPRFIYVCFLAIGLHHSVYLWTVKHRQFERRSEPIEAFLRFLESEPRRPILVHCSDYLFAEARRAAHLRRGESEQNLIFDVSTTDGDAPSYCLPKL